MRRAQHVQHQCGLVVHERSEDPRLIVNLAEPVSQIDRPLVGVAEAPASQLRQDVLERLVAVLPLHVECGEVLGQPFAQPLLVIILPPDSLAPPLVCELVREEKGRMNR